MNKIVLVTGATGFLGRHLVPSLEKLGYQVLISNSKQTNLLEYENLTVFDEFKFDYIFHLAAYTKAGDWCLYHPAEQFEINQRINTNILKY
jgi:GDP-L-fucose synthase